MERELETGKFWAISELEPGCFFQFTMNGTEYQLAGVAASGPVVRRPLYVCRRVELDGRNGNFFVVEDDRPVILTRRA